MPCASKIRGFEIVEVGAPVEALRRWMVVKRRDGFVLRTHADLVMSFFNGRQARPFRPLDAVRAGRKKQGAVRRVFVARDKIDEAAPRQVPRLHVGKVVHVPFTALEAVGRVDPFKRIYGVGLRAAVDVRGTRQAVRSGEDPDVPSVVDGDDGIVVGIRRVLVEQNGRAGHLPGFVVEIGDHVQQKSRAVPGKGTVPAEVCCAVFAVCINRRAAVTEKGLIDFGTVRGKRAVFGAIRAQAAAVFVRVLIAGWLVVIPYPAIARVFLVQGEAHGFPPCRVVVGRRKETKKEIRVKFDLVA